MKNWKKPKAALTRTYWRSRTSRMAHPEASATAKASMDRATASRKTVKNDMIIPQVDGGETDESYPKRTTAASFPPQHPRREEAPGPETTSAFLRGSHDHAPARQIRIPTARGKGCCPAPSSCSPHGQRLYSGQESIPCK